MINKKLKNESGYVLPYLLVTVLLITTLVVITFNLFSVYNKYEIRKYNKKKLDLACYSAVQQFLSGEFSNTETQVILTDSINVTLTCMYKGLYYKITATAKNKKDSSCGTYLLGSEIANPFTNAVVISKSNMNLIVTGKTKIKGDILGTTQRVTKGNIAGIEKASEEYLAGKIKSEPVIATKLFNQKLLEDVFEKQKEYLKHAVTIKGSVTLDNSFLAKCDTASCIYVTGDLVVSGELQRNNKKSFTISVTGKTMFESGVQSRIEMEIFSDSSVTVEKSNLENIIVYTKGKVTISNGTICKNVQFFASKGIECNGVRMNYPSLLCLNSGEVKSPGNGNEIKISSSNINGTVMLVSSAFSSSSDKSKIIVQSNSTIQGLVYSENMVEVSESKIIGTVYTQSFYYYKKPTEYINWLVNQDINRNRLDKMFLLPLGFVKTPRLQIIKEEWNY